MEKYILYQMELFENLKNCEKNLRKTPKERIKKAYLETRLEQLETLWNDFKEGHKNIILKISKEEDRKLPYFKNEVFEAFEEMYISTKSMLKEMIVPFLKSSNNSQTTGVPDVNDSNKNCDNKLPIIKIPTFTGKYEEWQTFYDLFYSLIHNNEALSPVQKLHYLKSNLSGEPETLLRNFSITDANYEEAWCQLVKRYNNKRFNCNAILKILFTQKMITAESASHIKQLLDTTVTCLKALSNMGIDTHSWDIIINYLVISKLDSESMRQWEQHMCSGENLIVCCLYTQDRNTTKLSERLMRMKPPITPKKTCGSISNNVTEPMRKSLKKCLEYQEKLVYPCLESQNPNEGMIRENRCNWKPDGLIIGGVDSYRGEFPHMVHLGYGKYKTEWECGGVLLSEKFVLTAGHCSKDPRL